MFVLDADQVGSQTSADRVDDAIAVVTESVGERLVLAPERTAGDEFQLATDDASIALDVVRTLVRAGHWSVGVGVGRIDTPLPTSTRAASGSAFVRAREAVERSKDLPERFALRIDDGGPFTADDVEPLVALMLRAMSRRTPEGWELADLLDAGLTRAEAAEHLGISRQAVAKRFQAAELRDDQRVRAALATLLTRADTSA